MLWVLGVAIRHIHMRVGSRVQSVGSVISTFCDTTALEGDSIELGVCS